jgi:predicted nicotinamide N-methyase
VPLGYQVKYETVSGHGPDLIIRSLLDRAQWSDPRGQAASLGISSAAWPLFGMLWPSARVLAGLMQVHALQGRRILELGCGLALASMVMHRRGGDVTASDYHPLAASFLLENLRLNHLPVMKFEEGDWGGSNRGLGRFDLIIGSDLLYDRAQPQALSRFIAAHSSEDVDVLIVDPDRGNRASFSRCMADLGFSHSQTRVAVLPGSGAAYKGLVLRYWRGERAAH